MVEEGETKVEDRVGGCRLRVESGEGSGPEDTRCTFLGLSSDDGLSIGESSFQLGVEEKEERFEDGLSLEVGGAKDDRGRAFRGHVLEEPTMGSGMTDRSQKPARSERWRAIRDGTTGLKE